jgi:hypothetical protein
LFAVAAPDKELRDILDVEGNGQSASKDTLGFCPVLSRESPSSETDTAGKPLNLPESEAHWQCGGVNADCDAASDQFGQLLRGK